MRRKLHVRAWCVLLYSALFLQGCSRTEPAPALSPWSEQVEAIERAVGGQNSGYQLAQISIFPQRPVVPLVPGGPVALKLYFLFVKPKASQSAGENVPGYDAREVKYDDHLLATTLKVNDFRRSIKDEIVADGVRSIRVGPQDALKATQADGEAFMGAQAGNDNMLFYLFRPTNPPEELHAPIAWRIVYLRKGKSLFFLVDAQTGAILKREIEEESASSK